MGKQYERIDQIVLERFEGKPLLVRSPGRVNLIGEHTDYNGGFVFPMANDRAARIALRPRNDRRIRVHAVDFGETVEFDVASLTPGSSAGHWSEYVKGMAWSLRDGGLDVRGWDGVLGSDVPVGAGLSSSAAIERLQAVADAGYNEADQLEACEQAGIETYVADKGQRSGQTNAGQRVFPKERFRYDPVSDAYHCPAGQRLSRGYEHRYRGKDVVRYYNCTACRECSLKGQCTHSLMRMISRRKNEAVVERQKQRMAARPEMARQRRSIVEHVFGSLRNWGHDRFLMRGLENVRAEFSLSALT